MNPYSKKKLMNFVNNLHGIIQVPAEPNCRAEILRNSVNALGTIYSPGEEAEICFVIGNVVVAPDRIKKFISEGSTLAVFNSGPRYRIKGSNSVNNNQKFLRITGTAHGLVFMMLDHADMNFPRGFKIGNVRISDKGKGFVLKGNNDLVDCCLIPPNERPGILDQIECFASKHSECDNMKCGDVDGGRDCIQYFNKDSYTDENLITYITSSSIEDQCNLVFNGKGEVIGFHISHCHLVYGSSGMYTIAKAVCLRE